MTEQRMPADVYRELGDLLGCFGLSKISGEAFWAEMGAHGWDQDAIDTWCEENRRRNPGQEGATLTDASIIGLRVYLERGKDRPCDCGWITFVVKEGGALHCSRCNRYRGKLPEKAVEILTTTISLLGRRQPGLIEIKESELTDTGSANAVPLRRSGY